MLLSLQKKRELIAEKTRALQHTKLRVRPSDMKTLQRAKALVAEQPGASGELREEEEAVASAEAAIERLARKQREQLALSQRRRGNLARELVEERILREELAAEGGS